MSLVQMNELLSVVDMLHSATRYLAGQFSLDMTQSQAQANVNARTTLINLQNCLMDDAYDLSGLTEAGGFVDLKVTRRIKRRSAEP